MKAYVHVVTGKKKMHKMELNPSCRSSLGK